jgi:type II secretory pathway pseudopilin PulG
MNNNEYHPNNIKETPTPTGSSPRKPERNVPLHMQRAQQNEIRRQYLRQQRRRQQHYQQQQQQQQNNNNNQPSSQPLGPSQGPTVRVPVGREASTTTTSAPTGSSPPLTTQSTPVTTSSPQKYLTPAEVMTLINRLHYDLTLLVRQLGSNDVPIFTVTPLWDLPNPTDKNSSDEEEEENETTAMMINEYHQSIFHRTAEIQKQLKSYVELKWIRPGTIHRHEFVSLVGHLLHIYSCLDGNVTTLTTTTSTPPPPPNHALLQQTLELIDWIRRPPYGLELSHKQCHAVITVAAKCDQWTTAARIYSEHIDPDVAGYIPVPVATVSARSFTIAGLYCIARAAIDTATLPVENVFDGVTKLTMVSPSDTESCK